MPYNSLYAASIIPLARLSSDFLQATQDGGELHAATAQTLGPSARAARWFNCCSHSDLFVFEYLPAV